MDRENNTKIIERLCYFLDNQQENFHSLSKKIGVSNSYFNKMNKNGGSIGADILHKIVLFYEQLNLDWLLTGRGEMLKNSQIIGNIDNSNVIGANVNGNGIHINSAQSELIDIIKKQQEQIGELIGIINKYEK